MTGSWTAPTAVADVTRAFLRQDRAARSGMLLWGDVISTFENKIQWYDYWTCMPLKSSLRDGDLRHPTVLRCFMNRLQFGLGYHQDSEGEYAKKTKVNEMIGTREVSHACHVNTELRLGFQEATGVNRHSAMDWKCDLSLLFQTKHVTTYLIISTYMSCSGPFTECLWWKVYASPSPTFTPIFPLKIERG